MENTKQLKVMFKAVKSHQQHVETRDERGKMRDPGNEEEVKIRDCLKTA